MPYNFLPYDQHQLLLMPPDVNDWVAEGSLPRFVSDLVDDLDERGKLRGIYAKYREDGWGRAGYHPRMMVKVILYGYAVGVRSSRRIETALEENVAFRYLAGNQKPNFRTISDFRMENLDVLEGLFVDVLELCKQAGLVKLGVVAMDGRKIGANASIDRNRSSEQLAKQILQEAEEIDAREDEQFGKDKRGDELPEKVRTRAGRKKVFEAWAQIEGMKKKAEEEQAKRVQAWEEAKARGEKKIGPKPRHEPRKRKRDQIDKFKPNTTDPESRVMKTRRGWLQGYNGQIMVDCGSQVIVAHLLTNEADDSVHLPALLERCEEQAGARPQKGLADTGYLSAANAALSDERTDLLIALEPESRMNKRIRLGKTPDQQCSAESEAVAWIENPLRVASSDLSAESAQDPPARKARRRKKQSGPENPEVVAMRNKLDAERDTYKLRCQTVEPVFGQMSLRDLNRFLLRGLRKVAGEWSLFGTSHNILKLFRSGWTPNKAGSTA